MSAWVLVPLAIAAWGFMHASGVHATIAGVVLGFAVPALARTGESVSIAEHLEHISLLIGELSFGTTSPHSEHVKAAVLVGSLTAAALGGILLTWRTRVHIGTQSGDLEPVSAVQRKTGAAPLSHE